MGGVLKNTFATEIEKTRFRSDFGVVLGTFWGLFGVILVAKWGFRGTSLRGRNFDGKKGQEGVGGRWRQLAAISRIWVPGPTEQRSE